MNRQAILKGVSLYPPPGNVKILYPHIFHFVDTICSIYPYSQSTPVEHKISLFSQNANNMDNGR